MIAYMNSCNCSYKACSFTNEHIISYFNMVKNKTRMVSDVNILANAFKCFFPIRHQKILFPDTL